MVHLANTDSYLFIFLKKLTDEEMLKLLKHFTTKTNKKENQVFCDHNSILDMILLNIIRLWLVRGICN